MAARGRPKAELVLTDDERETLERWERRPKSSRRLALRSRIVLECASGSGNGAVAAKLGVSAPTVGKWRARFVRRRLQGLVDEQRCGVPRTITDEQVKKVLTQTLEQTPADATHWSRTSMATNSGLSKSTVGRIWKAFSLKPHLSETFTLSQDPLFVEKVRDVVGLYLNPPERAVVLCVDEKSQVQAPDRSQPVLPMMPGGGWAGPGSAGHGHRGWRLSSAAQRECDRRKWAVAVQFCAVSAHFRRSSVVAARGSEPERVVGEPRCRASALRCTPMT